MKNYGKLHAVRTKNECYNYDASTSKQHNTRSLINSNSNNNSDSSSTKASLSLNSGTAKKQNPIQIEPIVFAQDSFEHTEGKKKKK